MTEEFEVLFPEINLIEDEVLRQKTISVWLEALKQGGWSLEDLKRLPFTLLIPGTKINLLTHVRAVTQCALRLAEVIQANYGQEVKLNKDILIAGALLHDVGKVLEFENKEGKFVKSRVGELVRHPFAGAALASRFDLPLEIIHIIAGHSKEGDSWKRTIEGIIIHHADFVNFDTLKS
ncbi:MAG: HD domain-containing protein [Candidatus Aminicenantes bacterium]|nr:HD domain-containing protein [Candidatus Aminicenantes bacterium]